MRLATIVHGTDTELPPLVIAHGLFGSARNWGVVAKKLSTTRKVIAVDMRNHGDSPRHGDHGYEDMAGDLAETIAAEGGRAAVLGHSMGGKAAMVLALTAPALVERLIVADIAPVAYRHSQMEYVMAMRNLDLGGVTRRPEADARLAETVPDASLRAFFLQSLTIGVDGAGWKLNLDALGDQMGRILGFPAVTGAYPGPALFVTGGKSTYVRDENWPMIQTLFPQARREVIPEAGHWLHAEATGPFVNIVGTFLA